MQREVRISLAPADAARFDAAAVQAGGKPALVRRFLNTLEELQIATHPTPQVQGRDLGKILVRLPPAAYGQIEIEAARLGLRKGPWVGGLVRAWLDRAPTLGRPDDLILAESLQQLRKIALSLRMLAQQADSPSECEAVLIRLEAEVRASIKDLQAILQGYGRYWGMTS